MTLASFVLLFTVGAWLCTAPEQFMRVADRIASICAEVDRLVGGRSSSGELARPRYRSVRIAGTAGLVSAVLTAYLGA